MAILRWASLLLTSAEMLVTLPGSGLRFVTYLDKLPTRFTLYHKAKSNCFNNGWHPLEGVLNEADKIAGTSDKSQGTDRILAPLCTGASNNLKMANCFSEFRSSAEERREGEKWLK